AVYRSRLLLDEDQAARGASLARIYKDLGFQQLAISEGYKSVNADPANASAHRFLSDSYAALPRHEIARVSELLQAQLLQPVGLNPVQPHLADPASFILRGAGPADMGFNEYNSLFDRNRVSLQMSGVVGSHSTIGDEVVVSGLYDRLAVSMGQFHYETHGFRKNNDQKKDIYNAFAQVSLSHDTSIQVEFRATDTDLGDLPLRFDPTRFFPKDREMEKSQSARFGLHHIFAPGSDLIVSFIYLKSKATTHTVIPILDFDFDVKSHDSSFSGEIQHLLRTQYAEITSGAGYLSTKQRTETTMENPFPPPAAFTEKAESNITYKNIYLYADLSYLKNVTATVGASADFFEHGVMDRKQLNPKLGITWNVLPNTMLRAAVFRTLNRNPLRSQTIEPTQVAGFNQLYDEAEGVKSWRAGIGLDHKFSSSLSAGLEFSKRDLNVPFLSVDLSSSTIEVREVDWHESFGRAYLYWTPMKCIGLSAEYLSEYFSRDQEFGGVEGIHKLRTNRVPLG
ncbi:MAG: TonB-dependent receptor, partial [Nitrospirota bacterium]|nr:TonB-dependent receptor [Nitrospirota bacterium]